MGHTATKKLTDMRGEPADKTTRQSPAIAVPKGSVPTTRRGSYSELEDSER